MNTYRQMESIADFQKTALLAAGIALHGAHAAAVALPSPAKATGKTKRLG